MKSFGSLALLILFVPALLVAGGLSPKYREWAASPQAYFMTKAERAQWTSIKTDAEAEQFVSDFTARRGAGFAEDVADRATNADKYLTIGKTKPGSKTLRGKVIVLLGPPSGIKTETKKGRTDMRGTTDGAIAALGDGGGTSVGEMVQVQQQSGMSSKQAYVEYTITYDADKLPAGYGKSASIVIQANPSTGDDWAPNPKAQAQLDELFEAVAAARASGK